MKVVQASMMGAMLACCVALAGCRMPGHPAPGPEVPRPEQVMSFEKLYGENCAGCHGAEGQNGAATDLANPVYQAIVDDASLRNVIANGEKGTLMPGFGAKAGGDLTDAQIDVLVQGMRAQWAKPNALAGVSVPPWAAGDVAHSGGGSGGTDGSSTAGNAANGATVYAQACARCHGAPGQKPGPAGSILDGSFLALVNAQTIRTTILAGRPDLGQPDWRNLIPRRPMTDAEIRDVTAWMLAQRPLRPGQRYSSNPTANQAGGQTSPQAQPSAVQRQ